MPLTQKIELKTALQQGNRVQIPKFVRLQFNIEPNQVLKVGVSVLDVCRDWHSFYAKIGKDGRIFIPKLTLFLSLKNKPSLKRYIIEVTLEPT